MQAETSKQNTTGQRTTSNDPHGSLGMGGKETQDVPGACARDCRDNL